MATGEGNTATLGGVELPEAEGGGGEGEPGGGGGGGQVEGGLVAGAQGVALVEPVVAGERGGGGAGGAGQGGQGWGGGKEEGEGGARQEQEEKSDHDDPCWTRHHSPHHSQNALTGEQSVPRPCYYYG